MEKVFNYQANKTDDQKVQDLNAEVANIYKKIKIINSKIDSSVVPPPPEPLPAGIKLRKDGDPYFVFEPMTNTVSGDTKQYFYESFCKKTAVRNRIMSERAYLRSFLPHNTEVYMKFEFILQAKRYDEEVNCIVYRPMYNKLNDLTNIDLYGVFRQGKQLVTTKPQKYIIERPVKLMNPSDNTFCLEIVDLNDNIILHGFKITAESKDVDFFRDGTNIGVKHSFDLNNRYLTELFYEQQGSDPKIKFISPFYGDELTPNIDETIKPLTGALGYHNIDYPLGGISGPISIAGQFLPYPTSKYNNGVISVLGFNFDKKQYCIQSRDVMANERSTYKYTMAKSEVNVPITCTLVPYYGAFLREEFKEKINSTHLGAFVYVEYTQTNRSLANEVPALDNERPVIKYGTYNYFYEVLETQTIDNVPFKFCRSIFPIQNTPLNPAFIVCTDTGNYFYHHENYAGTITEKMSHPIRFSLVENLGNDLIVDASAYTVDRLTVDGVGGFLEKISFLVKRADGIYCRKYNLTTKSFEGTDLFVGAYRKVYISRGTHAGIIQPTLLADGTVNFACVANIDV